jgi:hypothetical protein
VLADGDYDVIVIDASAEDGGATVLEVTILAGPHKGEVVAVRATGLEGDPLDRLGMPGTLTVADGAPAVRLDR